MQRIQSTTDRNQRIHRTSHANNVSGKNMYLHANNAESGYAKNAAVSEESVSALT